MGSLHLAASCMKAFTPESSHSAGSSSNMDGISESSDDYFLFCRCHWSSFSRTDNKFITTWCTDKGSVWACKFISINEKALKSSESDVKLDSAELEPSPETFLKYLHHWGDKYCYLQNHQTKTQGLCAAHHQLKHSNCKMLKWSRVIQNLNNPLNFLMHVLDDHTRSVWSSSESVYNWDRNSIQCSSPAASGKNCLNMRETNLGL